MSETLAALNRNSPFAGIGEWIATEGGELTERVLFLSYLGEHFSSYADTQKMIGEAESVLAYEQEYILCGNTKDAINLYEVIGKLLAVRIIFNLIHVLSDAEKCTGAGEVALGLLGVTGLPVLVSILKYFLLFIWAAEAALAVLTAGATRAMTNFNRKFAGTTDKESPKEQTTTPTASDEKEVLL